MVSYNRKFKTWDHITGKFKRWDHITGNFKRKFKRWEWDYGNI
jgi:hypothetical protein